MDKGQKAGIDEYKQLEIKEIFIRTREQINIRLQIYSLLGTAHLICLGLAFTNQKISILFIAIFFLIALIIIDQNLKGVKAATELRGLQLENEYSQNPDDSLHHLSIALSTSNRRWIDILDSINKIQDPQARILALRRRQRGFSATLVFPLAMILIEIGLVINFLLIGWKIY